ncbi:hypothetical protein HRG_002021 [Hirsutella rhossiliensis]|uniref:Uncharacterized protein n=1 Tax=Hirsutella rhossiliensis TaxID=111463 RepID=A0A9P8N8K2_9HYPO|nr:uncharacterized protein HRG_02021 [Hirsutella rhossiliensis]KAH0966612.1 hypothetical protein HRG_02021 [Hirsutella rhossiliensis]
MGRPDLGAPFMYAAYAVFDMENQVIHLADAANCGSNLVAIKKGPNGVPSVDGDCPPRTFSTPTPDAPAAKATPDEAAPAAEATPHEAAPAAEATPHEAQSEIHISLVQQASSPPPIQVFKTAVQEHCNKNSADPKQCMLACADCVRGYVRRYPTADKFPLHGSLSCADTWQFCFMRSFANCPKRAIDCKRENGGKVSRDNFAAIAECVKRR